MGEAETGVFAYECTGRRSEVKGSEVEITEIYSNIFIYRNIFKL